MASTIPNPGSWSVDQIGAAGKHIGQMTREIGGGDIDADALPRVRKLEMEDLRIALRKGMEDFTACRSDVMFLCLLYPIIGIFLAWVGMQRELLPLLFPVMSGFALVGPVAAVGLYEMSRRREMGEPVGYLDAFRVASSPAFSAILALGIMLFATFTVWMILADMIYRATLGPEAPASMGAFLVDLFTTGAGWMMIIIGMGVGALFAFAVLATSVISFPLLLDRHCGMPAAVVTSVKLTRRNPVVILTWGIIVAGSLAIGSIPAFLGLIVVMPVLGHATWHLYRRAIDFETE
ncbi:DUF2189 domain-containing protein [Amaricoccus macauensis]|uniref:DUF2189 domain-containing protein n=1 Tax=Amaricoccus macauensis TaxID=57001 RepID=UPI003C7DB077